VFVSFEDVMAYTTHVPSFADTWGWVMVIKIRRKIACVINLSAIIYLFILCLKYRLQTNHYSLVLRKWTKDWKKE
jgi:hypothetical protein